MPERNYGSREPKDYGGNIARRYLPGSRLWGPQSREPQEYSRNMAGIMSMFPLSSSASSAQKNGRYRKLQGLKAIIFGTLRSRYFGRLKLDFMMLLVHVYVGLKGKAF